MRTIERSAQFKRDYKRLVASGSSKSIEADLLAILKILLEDLPLPLRNKDHALAGNWTGFRDCHIRPDLVLIYRKVGSDSLELARLGSHSELF